MARIDSALFDIGSLEDLAQLDSAMHRLDPRAKLVTTAVFILCIASFGKYEISALLPYLIFPMFLMIGGRIPPGVLFRRLMIAAPFALLVGVFNPFFDRDILMTVGPLHLSGGWISFVSVEMRFLLTASAALLLIATTGFITIALALERLGAPRIFTLQLLFLYRYLSLLINEAVRLARARSLRTFNGRGMGMRVYGHLTGQLLLRTLERAHRIHQAMLCRSFDGEIRLSRSLRFGTGDAIYLLGWSGLFITLRYIHLPQWVGHFLMELPR